MNAKLMFLPGTIDRRYLECGLSSDICADTGDLPNITKVLLNEKLWECRETPLLHFPFYLSEGIEQTEVQYVLSYCTYWQSPIAFASGQQRIVSHTVSSFYVTWRWNYMNCECKSSNCILLSGFLNTNLFGIYQNIMIFYFVFSFILFTLFFISFLLFFFFFMYPT